MTYGGDFSWRRSTACLLMFGSLMTVPVGAALSAEASFDPAGTDKEVSLQATIETRPVDASGQIRVVLRGAKGTVKVRLNPLHDGSAAGRQIPASQITVEEKVVEPGPVTTLAVTVRGIDRPGAYQGTFNLSLAPADGAAAQPPVAGQPAPITTADVKLTLYVLVKPQIESPDTSVAASFSNCTFACAFSEIVSPGAVDGGVASIAVANKSPTALRFSGVMDVKGATRNAVQSVPARSDVVIEAGARSRIFFDFPREKFASDHYAGTAVVTASAVSQPALAAIRPDGSVAFDNRTMMSVPAAVDVRDGALIPFVVILIGVVAGRLAKVLSDASREARVALFPRYTFLKDQIGKLENQGAKTRCDERLEDIWTHVLEQNATDAKFKQDFDNLGGSIELLGKLERLERELNARVAAANVRAPIAQQLQNARNALLADNPDLTAAQNAINQARSAIQTAANPPPPGPGVAAAVPTIAAAHGTFLAGEARDLAQEIAGQRGQEQTQQQWPRRWANGLMWFFSGIDTTDTIAFNYWFWRPLTYVVLLVVLAFYGLWILYGGADHATFGSKGFSEYIALFLWGLAAQTVSMTLQDVQFTRR